MAPRIKLPGGRLKIPSRGKSARSRRLRFRQSVDEGPTRVTGLPGANGANGRGSNGGGPTPPVSTIPPRPPGPTPRRRRPKLRKLRIALVFFGLSILAFISWIFGIMMAVASDLPQLEDRAQFANAENSVVLDINGNKIATLTNNQGRILINSADIAPVMKEATVAIEDQRFYEHRGVDFVGIGRAVVQDVLHTGTQQGASTITEQFVKNALRAQGSRTVFQKLREAALAYQLERHWDKDKILTQYLNEIYFGNGAYGIEAAAKTYFGYNHPGCGSPEDRCASDLLPWEAAMLAGIISSPSAYDPVVNPSAALARRNLVLSNMVSQGDITQEEYAQYIKEPLPKPGEIHTTTDDSLAPYFTSWLRQQLVDKYGSGEAFGGGLQVYSTLDLPFQKEVSRIAYERTAGVGLDSAVVVLDNQTAGVRAMVGGTDYAKRPFNLATQGHRQPGSAFKPFTLVTALEQGRSPDEVFTSAPQQLPYKAEVPAKGGGTKVVPELFDVSNYEDTYQGSASLATATTYSDNSVYSQLGMSLDGGIRSIADTAYKMGIQTDLSTTKSKYSVGDGPFEPYNPALILGGLESGVTPLEMAHAFETLAHDGQIVSGTMADSPDGPIGIQRVDDEDGNPVETNNGDPGQDRVETKQVISPTVAATARSMLHSVVASGTGTNADTGDPYVFGKTGTTENNGDAWFVGANQDVTIAVWVGHADSVTPMETEYGGAPVDGGTIPALIFNDVLTAYESLKKTAGPNNHAISPESTTTTTTSSVPTTTTAAPTTTAAVAPTTTTTTAAAPVTDSTDTSDTSSSSSAPAPAPSDSSTESSGTSSSGTSNSGTDTGGSTAVSSGGTGG
jgi:penicillin-binding protein 1A